MAKFLTLRQQADEFFHFALQQTSNHPSLQQLQQQLQHCYQRLGQPMRVAIVGKIKAGKSTTMNALLGEAVVATGTVEATFNVNWLKYGEKSYLKVHFKDNRPPESKSFAELATLTLRSDEHRRYLLSIKYIEVFYPNPILKTFNLIDTPGLESFYKDDSDNTLEFLRLYGQELTNVTQTQAANADAVMYLFSQSINLADQSVMEEFQGPTIGRATPLNAIGVLTRIDYYWPSVEDPLLQGRKISQRLISDYPQLRNLFYTIYPVTGFLALGAQTLKADEYQILTQLATLGAERFDRLIRTVERFAEKDYANEPDIPPPSARQKVLERLGQYGVMLACRLIQGGVKSQAQLSQELFQRSGIPNLKKLINSHFGNRAFLIKFNTGLQQLRITCFRERQQQTGKALQIVEEIGSKIEKIATNAHDFQELKVIRSYYEQKLAFTPDEVKQLLEVTGENGTSCAQRLGLNERSTVAEMLPIAQKRASYWRNRASDLMSVDNQTLEAIQVLAESYERILYHVQEAKKHLYL